MNDFDKLIAYFEQFPGIGARQAKRFVFHILTLPEAETTEMARIISSLKGSVIECMSCRRFFTRHNGESTCSICSDPNRDHGQLLVVERDNDIQAIERSGTYSGLYFVLGGTLPLLNTKEHNTLRSNGLKKIIAERTGDLQEIILGFSINPDGENTMRFVESLLDEELESTTIKITHLGRGLSTGSELEYADPETLKEALRRRY